MRTVQRAGRFGRLRHLDRLLSDGFKIFGQLFLSVGQHEHDERRVEAANILLRQILYVNCVYHSTQEEDASFEEVEIA